jgi:hypothetical protein
MSTIVRTLLVVDNTQEPSDLLNQWLLGHYSNVVDVLSQDHCGMTASFIAYGFEAGVLQTSDLYKLQDYLMQKCQLMVETCGP